MSNSRISIPSVIDSRTRGYGRLVSLSSQMNSVAAYLTDRRSESSSSVIVHFPAMPDSIDLVRSADYRVQPGYVVPDGIHLYRSTKPLEIPFSFRVHHSDPFCSKGPISLLVIAAKLHSLVIPINTASDRRFVSSVVSPEGVIMNQTLTRPATGQPPPVAAGASSSGTEVARGQAPSASDNTSVAVGSDAAMMSTVFPATCLLDLVTTGELGIGIRCIGYIKDVAVKLNGPWMNGRDPKYKNLPTSLDCSFTFVHHPSHTNNVNPIASSSLAEVGAFADDVRKKLYDSVDLVKNELGVVRTTHIGLGESPPARVVESDAKLIDSPGTGSTSTQSSGSNISDTGFH